MNSRGEPCRLQGLERKSAHCGNRRLFVENQAVLLNWIPPASKGLDTLHFCEPVPSGWIALQIEIRFHSKTAM